MRRPALLSICFLVAGAGCGESVDCDALCARTLRCEVSFAAEDDPEGAKVKSGLRTDAESCALGCAESPYVNVESAKCIDGVTEFDPPVCQPQVLDCLGYTAGSSE